MVLILAFLSLDLHSQHQEINDAPKTWKGNEGDLKTGNSILTAFKNGQTKGHFRQFTMVTHNKRDLSDYYAVALGGGIKYETAAYKNFRFSVSGFYIYNASSSDLGRKDTVANQSNRYEIGLFDIENPDNKTNIDRLEELYLKYQTSLWEATIGKQLINTPFINLQDGRMRPTITEGLRIVLTPKIDVKVDFYYLYSISPRSTAQFYSIEESIGIYPTGVSTSGGKSGYKDNLSSKGIFMLGLQKRNAKSINYQFWNMIVDNIFYSSLAQIDYIPTKSKVRSLFGGIQSIYQTPINEGGNTDIKKAYFDKTTTALTLGAQIGWKSQHSKVSFNFNRIFSTGRYLMPREWGRDPFYTFLPRERNEGLGNVTAVMAQYEYSIAKMPLALKIGLGYYKLPSPEDVALNKYGMPSYSQANLDVHYIFGEKWKGFDLHFLYAYKFNQAKQQLSQNQIFNKVDMGNLNLIVNFHF